MLQCFDIRLIMDLEISADTAYEMYGLQERMQLMILRTWATVAVQEQ